MADAKFFSKGKASEIEEELKALDKAGKPAKKKDVLKRIVANMTMGNDMSSLFNHVIQCAAIQDPDVKKLIYLYLINYSKSLPDLATLAINLLVKDSADPNPLVRAQAIRTMGYISTSDVTHSLCEVLRHGLKDPDPFVRKTSVTGVSKLFTHNSSLCIEEGFISMLQEMLNNDQNGLVVACILATLREISEFHPEYKISLSLDQATKFAEMTEKCSEWYQFYILDSFMFFTPTKSEDAEALSSKLLLRLQHTNAAVCLNCIKVLLHLLSFSSKSEFHQFIYQKISTALVTLMQKDPEIQYMTLQNIILIIQLHPTILANDVSIFFCLYTDPIYVKLAKLEVLAALANERNASQILSELKEYASEIDIEFVKKAVKYIGRCAIQLPSMADACLQVLNELIETRVSYVLEEIMIVFRDIFRKYPNKYEPLIVKLSEYLEDIQDSEAKAAFIWILGQYCDQISQAGDLLSGFANDFALESLNVQQALLTAVVRYHLRQLPESEVLYKKVMDICMHSIENPDLRNSAFIYSRFIQQDVDLAKKLNLQKLPIVAYETKKKLSTSLVQELVCSLGSLACVLHVPMNSFKRNSVLKKDVSLRTASKEDLLKGTTMDSNSLKPSLSAAATASSSATNPSNLIDFDTPSAAPQAVSTADSPSPRSKASDHSSSVFYDLSTIESTPMSNEPYRSTDVSPSKSFVSALDPPFSNSTTSPPFSNQPPPPTSFTFSSSSSTSPFSPMTVTQPSLLPATPTHQSTPSTLPLSSTTSIFPFTSTNPPQTQLSNTNSSSFLSSNTAPLFTFASNTATPLVSNNSVPSATLSTTTSTVPPPNPFADLSNLFQKKPSSSSLISSTNASQSAKPNTTSSFSTSTAPTPLFPKPISNLFSVPPTTIPANPLPSSTFATPAPTSVPPIPSYSISTAFTTGSSAFNLHPPAQTKATIPSTPPSSNSGIFSSIPPFGGPPTLPVITSSPFSIPIPTNSGSTPVPFNASIPSSTSTSTLVPTSAPAPTPAPALVPVAGFHPRPAVLNFPHFIAAHSVPTASIPPPSKSLPLVLKRQDGGGLELRAGIQRSMTTLYLELTLLNTTMAPLSHFAFKVKDNPMGLQLPSTFPLTSLPPNTLTSVVLPFLPGFRHLDRFFQELEAAIRTSQGVYFFKLSFPFPFHFCEPPTSLTQDEFFIQLSTQQNHEKTVNLLNTFEAVKRKLELCSFKPITSSQESGDPPVLHSYFSARLISQVPVCIHIKSNANFVTSTSTFDRPTIRVVSAAEFILDELLRFLEGP